MSLRKIFRENKYHDAKWICKDDVYLANNKLENLVGSPYEVNGNFDVSSNELTTLKGCPKEIGKSFLLYNNKLKNLKYFPKYLGENLVVSHNELETLRGIPKKINGILNLSGNHMINADDIIDYVESVEIILLFNMELINKHEIKKLIDSGIVNKKIKWSGKTVNI